MHVYNFEHSIHVDVLRVILQKEMYITSRGMAVIVCQQYTSMKYSCDRHVMHTTEWGRRGIFEVCGNGGISAKLLKAENCTRKKTPEADIRTLHWMSQESTEQSEALR